MNSLALRAMPRAGAPVAARPDNLECQLRRFRAEVQPRVRALAARHSRLADLAASFPALLFALAVPNGRFRAEAVIANVIAGRTLKSLSEQAGIALWMRKLRPETLVRPLPTLPMNARFAKRIVNHIPRQPKIVADWLDAVAFAARWGHEDFAIWYARNFPTKRKPRRRLPLLTLWAWYSGQTGTHTRRLLEKPWNPDIGYKTAREAASEWLAVIDLHTNLGAGKIADVWLAPGVVDGYEFVPLISAQDLLEEAGAMKNCVRGYGSSLAHNYSRLWSIRKDGARVATLQISSWTGHPVAGIYELQAAENRDASVEVWRAAAHWLRQQDLVFSFGEEARWDSVPLDRKTWLALWKPFWLAKRTIPHWLPLAPSRAALRAL
jgi:hypothetical protein